MIDIFNIEELFEKTLKSLLTIVIVILLIILVVKK